MRKYIFICFISILFNQTTFAKKGNPVPHKHGQRTHTHPLPNTGINHSHNSQNKNKTQKGWVFITSAKGTNTRYEAKSGSYRETTTSGGKSVATIIVQTTDPRTNAVSLSQRYISLSDCKRGLGKLVALDMNGKFKYENDVVYNGNSVASEIASTICDVGNQNKGKGFN